MLRFQTETEAEYKSEWCMRYAKAVVDLNNEIGEQGTCRFIFSEGFSGPNAPLTEALQAAMREGSSAAMSGTPGPQISLARVGRLGKALRRMSEVVEGRSMTAPAPAHNQLHETKRQRRERENLETPGGMRAPWRYVRGSTMAQQVGKELAVTIDAFLDANPKVVDWLIDGGAEGRKLFRENQEEQLAAALAETLHTNDIALSRNGRWRPGLLEAYCDRARDPEKFVPSWLRDGAPTGVVEPIPPSNVFPCVETESFATEELKKYYDITEPRRNYKSTEENATLFEREIVRLNKEGFVDVFPTWKDLLRAEPEVIVSKMVALTKQREDGTIKLRTIVDMLRSMVNSFVKLKERIVLPRLFDIVVNLMLLMSVAAGSCDDIVEMLVMDTPSTRSK